MSVSKILERYSGLPDGVGLSGQLCPECEGGVSKEYSMSVSRDGDLLKWMCHRNSCTFRGTVSLLLTNPTSNSNILPSPKRKLRFTSSPLPEEALTFLNNRYRITPDLANRFGLEFTNDLCTSPDGRVVIPIQSRDLARRGYVLRAINSTEQRKAINVLDGSDSGLCWFTHPGSSAVLLVEDAYSAIRASRYINSCALLGTNLSSDGIEELLSSGLSKFYLGLDKDAFNKTIDTVYRYKSRIDLKGVPLSKDIKDMTEEELLILIEELSNG